MMSKAAAIDIAIRLQLAADGKVEPGLRQCLGARTAAGTTAAGADVYNASSIRGFLANVAFRLRADSPPLIFDWAALDPAQCLSDDLWVLEQAIADKTTEMPEAEPKNAAK